MEFLRMSRAFASVLKDGDGATFLQVRQYRSQLEGRTMLVKKLKMLPVEAIVRGYITGSGWKVCRSDDRP
jgi:phosphoribosylaminoimidazole-succinocarboxamide synthase